RHEATSVSTKTKPCSLSIALTHTATFNGSPGSRFSRGIRCQQSHFVPQRRSGSMHAGSPHAGSCEAVSSPCSRLRGLHLGLNMSTHRPIALLVTLLLLACNKRAEPEKSALPRADASAPNAPDTQFLDEAAARAANEIESLETSKDVTCWTSFRQL